MHEFGMPWHNRLHLEAQASIEYLREWRENNRYWAICLVDAEAESFEEGRWKHPLTQAPQHLPLKPLANLLNALDALDEPDSLTEILHFDMIESINYLKLPENGKPYYENEDTELASSLFKGGI